MSTEIEWSMRVRWYAWAIGVYCYEGDLCVYIGPIEIVRRKVEYP